ALHLYSTSGLLYVRPLNAAGDGWEGADWGPYEVTPIYAYADLTGPHSVGTLEAALSVSGTDWIVYRTQGVRRAYPKVSGKVGYVVNDGGTRFRGALPGSGDSSIFLFYDDDQPIYREITKTAGLGTAYLPTSSMTTLARHSGSFAPFFFVMQKTGDYGLTF